MTKPLTALERATQEVQEFAERTGLINSDGHYAEMLVEQLRKAFKEQDRDTRHACAEAVIQCHDYNELNGDSDLKLIEASEAHNVCMNIQITE